METPGLEARVSKVEVHIESITTSIATMTQSVSELATVVRTQDEHVEAQMRQLLVAVTAAAGPRKTEWGVIISALGVLLAIGAAAFSPLLLQLGHLQSDMHNMEISSIEHSKLPLHPVGHSRIDALELALRESSVINANAIKELDTANKVIRESIFELNLQIARLLKGNEKPAQ
jgi:hypothetical protein